MPSYSAVSLTSTRTRPLSDFRNKIINGNMDIWQRASRIDATDYIELSNSAQIFTAALNVSLIEGMTTDDAKWAGPDTDYAQNMEGYGAAGGEPSDLDFINSDIGEVNTEGSTDHYGFGTPSKPGPAMTMGTSGDLSYRYGPDRFAFQSSNQLKYALYRTLDTPTTEESKVRFNSALRVVPCVPLGNINVELTGDTDAGPQQALILGGLDINLNDPNYDGGDRNVPIQKFAHIIQVVEGYNIASLINSFSTLSFWVKSSVPGTYSCSIRNASAEGMDGFDVTNLSENNSSGHYYVSEYNIPEANTWYKIEVKFKVNPVESLPGLNDETLFTNGGWDATYGPGLIIGWTLVAHDDYQTNKVNRWQRIGSDNKYRQGADGEDASRFRYTKYLPAIASPNQVQFNDVPKDWRRVVWEPTPGKPKTDKLLTHFPEKIDPSGEEVEGGPDLETGFFLTGVQLEEGTDSSDFEVRSRTDEISLCNRYFVKSMTDYSDALIDMGPHDGGVPSGSSAVEAASSIRTQGKLVSGVTGEISYVNLPEDMRTIPTVAAFNNYSGDGRGVGIDWALFSNYNSRKQIVAYTTGLRKPLMGDIGFEPAVPTIANVVAGESHWIANCEFFGGTISEGSRDEPFTLGA